MIVKIKKKDGSEGKVCFVRVKRSESTDAGIAVYRLARRLVRILKALYASKNLSSTKLSD